MLTVFEIYPSIQGESTHAGRPCVFVRLTACDLRCSWCDTVYAFHEGRKMSIDDVVGEVARYDCPTVEVTGGEPLLQQDVYPLMSRLLEDGKRVLLYTGTTGFRHTDAINNGRTPVQNALQAAGYTVDWEDCNGSAATPSAPLPPTTRSASDTGNTCGSTTTAIRPSRMPVRAPAAGVAFPVRVRLLRLTLPLYWKR